MEARSRLLRNLRASKMLENARKRPKTPEMSETSETSENVRRGSSGGRCGANFEGGVRRSRAAAAARPRRTPPQNWRRTFPHVNLGGRFRMFRTFRTFRAFSDIFGEFRRKSIRADFIAILSETPLDLHPNLKFLPKFKISTEIANFLSNPKCSI